MSHLYELAGLDGQSVNLQSFALLDNSSSYTTLVAADSSLCPGSFVIEDEGDVFQCGRCKKQFDSLTYFMRHKREGCSTIIETPSITKDYLSSVKSYHEFSSSSIDDGDNDRSFLDDAASDRTINSINASILPSVNIQNQNNNHGQEINDCSTSFAAGSTPVIHITPSGVLGEETLSFTIPLDQNSGLAQLLSGANSSSVLSIPENELAAILNAGARYHLSSSDSNNQMNHIYLTSPILPSNSNIKEAHTHSIQVTRHVSDPQIIDVCEDQLGDLESTNMHGQEENFSHAPVITIKSMIGGDNILRLRESNVPKPSNEFEDSFIDSNDVAKQSNIRDSTQSSSTSDLTTKKVLKKPELVKESSNIDSIKSQGSAEVKRKCEYCGKPFKKLFNLHQHIRSHTGEKPFHCLVCGRGFTQKSNVKKHMQTHKVWPKVKYTLPKEQISVKVKLNSDSDAQQGAGIVSEQVEALEYVVNNVYVCQYCDQNFENYHKLKTHLSHTHKNEKLFKCIHKDCLATFLEVEGLICHMKTHEDQIEYQCQNCPKKFKNLYDLGAHQYNHRLYPNKVSTTQQTKQFRCTKCNSKYASSEALNHHLLTSSHNYPCSQCKLTFVCERYLRRHLRIHGTVEPFRCDLCGKMFKTENYLKSHLVIHSDSKPFHCEICKQSFNRRDKLTRHKLMHDNRKKYKCPFKNTGCEREFYRKDKLKDHMMSHSRKNYPCSKCGKNFTWPTRLRQHQVEQHPEMMVNTTCPTCNKIFKTKHHLKLHICRLGAPLKTEGSVSEELFLEKHLNNEMVPEPENSGYTEEPINKVLYNECPLEDALNSSGERSEDAMLSSFSQSEDPDSVMLSRFADCEDRTDEHDDVLISPVEMSFETTVGTSMDEFMSAD